MPDAPFFLEAPVILDQPFAEFARCRAEEPVVFHEPWQSWFFFKFDDIAELGRDPRLSNRRMDLFIDSAPEHLREKLGFLEKEFGTMLMMLDGDEHRHVRQIMQQGFSNSAIQIIRDKIDHHIAELIASVRGKDRIDLSEEICRQLPLLVLSDLLGLPEKDFPMILRCAHAFVDYFNRQPAPEAQTLALIDAGWEFINYTRELIAERRATPGTDFLSTLIHGEHNGFRLTDDEVLANAVVLLIAGNDTVGSALGNAAYLLLTHPEELDRIIRGETTWDAAFDEVMRYEPANPVILRKVAETFDFHGHTLTAGQRVFLVLASGSRDETHFPDPEKFDTSREAARHLGFGTGAHYCIGSMLAKTEALALLPPLFQFLADYELDPARPSVWLRMLGLRGAVELPVRTKA